MSNIGGEGVVRRSVLVQIPGNLIEVAADPAVLGCPFTGLVVAEKEKQTFVVAVFQKSGGRK